MESIEFTSESALDLIRPFFLGDINVKIERFKKAFSYSTFYEGSPQDLYGNECLMLYQWETLFHNIYEHGLELPRYGCRDTKIWIKNTLVLAGVCRIVNPESYRDSYAVFSKSFLEALGILDTLSIK